MEEYTPKTEYKARLRDSLNHASHFTLSSSFGCALDFKCPPKALMLKAY
jgi:hypothetical protein